MNDLTLDIRNKNLLVIPDLHIPYHHPDAFRWLKKVKSHFKIHMAISLGDEIDGQSISFHHHSPELASPADELNRAIKIIHQKNGLHEQWPELYLCESNHGSLYLRRSSKIASLPAAYMKEYKDIYKTPKWRWASNILLKSNKGLIYCTHGRSSVALKMALSEGTSAIQGHYHSRFGINYVKTGSGILFNAFCGSLIDESSIAFEYGKLNLNKAVLGALRISKDGSPHLIKMDINKKTNRWSGKL